ncbi:MAG: VanW family protein [Patescibacteria group bacterium]
MKDQYMRGRQREIIWWVASVGLLSLFLVNLILDVAYAGKVLPRVYCARLNLSGQTYTAALSQIDTAVKMAQLEKITFQIDSFTKAYPFKSLGVVWSAAETAQAAVNFGHQGNWWNRLIDRGRALIFGVTLPVIYQEQLNLAEQIMAEIDHLTAVAGVDGDVVIDRTGKTASIESAVVGQALDKVALHKLLSRRLAQLDTSVVSLPVQLIEPIFSDDVTKLVANKLNQDLSQGYLLSAQHGQWELPKENLWQWVEVVKQKDSLIVRLRSADLEDYIQSLKQQIDQPVQDAVWEAIGEKVTKFQPDQPGVSLRSEATAELIQATLLTPRRQIELPIDYQQPAVTLSQLNNFGIQELVAQGESNFAGSPSNRRHNIKVGANRFDKVLIAPDATFSFNTILGEVTAETGYLPELVIKGDETTPEFGGGLCQVSTTVFRAALNGGYPIVARHNHTYRVSYYEPAGLDATVYQPYPDFKFSNDTEAYILIHTRIEGDILYFDFYSTKLDRRVELEGPRVYNVVEPPPPIYIETSTLPEGEEKKIDTAHWGAEVIVYRHIYDDNGREIRKDTFESFYIPWPAKYLKGAPVAPEVETDLGNLPPEVTAPAGEEAAPPLNY